MRSSPWRLWRLWEEKRPMAGENRVIRGLIFDFDGLMVDTETSARDSWLEIYREYGCDFPYSLWAETLGGSRGGFDACVYLAEQTGLQLDHDAFHARRQRRKLEMVAAQPLMPGIAAYLAESKQRDLKLGVASSS